MSGNLSIYHAIHSPTYPTCPCPQPKPSSQVSSKFRSAHLLRYTPNFRPPSLVAHHASLFDLYDRRVEARHQQTYRPFPVPPADRRRFHPADVSLVVPTVDTDFVVFAACLASWSRCAPGEIIVVATEAQAARVAEFLPGDGGNASTTRITLLAVDRPNKRHQLIKGIQASRGKILALVDDDARWESAETLTSLLAPFEVDDIGLVGGPVE